jgi:hypothetical protein
MSAIKEYVSQMLEPATRVINISAPLVTKNSLRAVKAAQLNSAKLAQ